MLFSKMQDRECEDFLGRAGMGRLACARNNQPYIVPIYFAYESGQLYGFATVGKKIEWMRANPLVCIQADEVLSNDKWTSIVVSGRYEELLDTTEFAQQRQKAQFLLEKRSLWWQTGYAASTTRGQSEPAVAVYFRIHIDEISGLRASSEGAPIDVR
jgi:nitroimidazol reductase NimA-like FMN-containing flavoprotein (pyridoxamine 5'-phosphate oxidase superfamily)